LADTINRRGHGGDGGDGASRAGGGASSTTGTSVASRAAANLVNGTDEDGPSTVVVKTAAAAEDLVRAEAQLSSKLRTAIRGSGAAKGRHTGAAAGKGTEQVARSLAKRRQARLEMARLRSSSAFVDWLWLGNTDRPDKIKVPGAGRALADAKTAPLPSEGVELSGTLAGEALGTAVGTAHSDGSVGGSAWGEPSAGKSLAKRGTSGEEESGGRGSGRSLAGVGSPETVASPGGVGAAAAGPGPATERDATPKQWTGAGAADGRVRRVKPDPMRPRRGSLGATAVDQILSEFDKHRTEGEGGRGAGPGAKRGRNARGVRGGGAVKAMVGRSASDQAGPAAGSAGSAKGGASAKPKNEQAPEKGNVHARIAARRRHVPDGGCARCWAVSTQCCTEAWELRQARREASRAGLVLTGRAQEAVEVLGLTQSQVRRLHGHFVDMDDGLEGRIHLNDFFEDFLELPRSAVTDAIWMALVENTTGQMLGFEDFVLMVCVYCMFTEEDILRFCFSTFDVNGERARGRSRPGGAAARACSAPPASRRAPPPRRPATRFPPPPRHDAARPQGTGTWTRMSSGRCCAS